jgi:hypothetical protein
LDNHRLRAKDLPVFVDDTVSRARPRGLRTPNSGGEPGPRDKAPDRSEECAASNEAPKHSEK